MRRGLPLVHDGDESGCAGRPSNVQAPEEKKMAIRTTFYKKSAIKRMSAWFGIIALAVLATCSFDVGAQIVVQAPRPAGKHIYSDTASPKADIAAALAKAKKEHKRVILDFGGDWCGDCQVLDIYFHQAPNVELLEKKFVLVHVWIGHMDANLDVAAKYGVPISRGVPALAVLSGDGKVLYSQATGQFADMRHMDPGSVNEFLKKWKS